MEVSEKLKYKEMDNNLRFMAQELPENEMKMLYSLLGKVPVNNKSLKKKTRFWNWFNTRG